MMTVDFNDYFWGEKNNGFDVLYHNMKFGLAASKEFADFVRERSNIEENTSKSLSKLANKAGNCGSQGTFAPLWQVLKTSSEKLSSLHLQMMQKLTELVKEVGKYAEELHKKHKSVKEEESGTLEAVQAMQNVTMNVQKAKDIYNQRALELDKLKKENGSSKEIEKCEQKVKKAQEDYKNFIEKYQNIKEEFEKKMSISVKNFQDLEVNHLDHMKEFLSSFADVVEWTHNEMGKVHKEFRQQCVEFTIDQLLDQFVRNKSTGLEKPAIVNLDEPVTSPSQETEPKTSATGFLRSRRDKANKKKIKKKQAKDSIDNQSNKEEKSDLEEKDDSQKSDKAVIPSNPPASAANVTTANATTVGPELDEDGYVIRPNEAVTHSSTWNEKNFYSSSDSDSDDGPAGQKIHVEIKPLNNGTAPMSASVDELRATVENLYLSPTGGYGRRGSNMEGDALSMKRSQSVSQQLGKPSSDLLGLNFQSPTASNASTPTSSHPYAPLQSPSQLALNSPTLSAGSAKYGDINEIFSEEAELPLPPPKQARQTPTPTAGYMSIPRPPSRRSDPNRTLMSTNANISRADSISSLEFRTAPVPVGVSRGPSPLTIGMADTIPLAVAFHEIIHAYFRGADESRCQVKMSGEMMLSFPAGIVTILANNPNPAKLVFKVKNTQRLTSVIPNKQLVALDPRQSATDYLGVEFNMTALSSLLKRQSEQNPGASYFNVDILKYQIKPNPGATSCPFQLLAYWKCNHSHSDLRVDYKYNLHAMTTPTALLNVNVAVPIEGTVKNMQTKPTAQWPTENNRLIYKYTELSQHTENNGVGSMLARFDLENGCGTPTTISAQFNCEGTTLSGIDFQLTGPGYRVSLVKRRFVSGKYICDGEQKFGSSIGSQHSSATSTVSSLGDPNC